MAVFDGVCDCSCDGREYNWRCGRDEGLENRRDVEHDDYVEWFWETYGEDVCDGYLDGCRDAYGYVNEDFGIF